MDVAVVNIPPELQAAVQRRSMQQRFVLLCANATKAADQLHERRKLLHAGVIQPIIR